MLFSILFVILVVYLLILPFILLKFIKFGLMIADDSKKASETPIFNVPKLPKIHKKAELSAEEQRAMSILQNIDTYDGTSLGQKEIKNG